MTHTHILGRIMFTKQVQGCRNGSVGKGFATQVWGFALLSRTHIKLDAVVCATGGGDRQTPGTSLAR